MQLNTVMDGDCLQVLNDFPKACIDLVVCDLPYGKTRAPWDSKVLLSDLWDCYRRVCRPGAVLALFATQPFATELIQSNRKMFRYDLIWVKNKSTGHLNARKMPMRKHEHVLVFYDTPSRFFPQKTSGHEPVNAFYTRASGSTFGSADKSVSGGGSCLRHPTSILEFPVLNNDDSLRIHNAQKPVALLRYLIRSYSQKGDTVLDNCSGSGSLAIAALEEGRNFVCVEKDADTAALSRSWIKRHAPMPSPTRRARG
jgi:DNA modification methylase